MLENHHVSASGCAQQAAEQALGLAEAVDVCGVKQGDAEFVGADEPGVGLFGVDVVPADRDAAVGCEYVHETREFAEDGSRLTDHSGLAVRLALTATGALLTSDLATVATPAEPDPTLF